jgi:uncharacterized protein
MPATVGLGAFEHEKYLNLETYRRSGAGVRTPVWFAAAPSDGTGAKIYVYTTADAGKTKRIRRSGVARIAPCDARGRVTGGWIDVHATIVGDDEFATGMRLLNRKYWPWKQILDLSTRLFPRHQRVVIAIRPD